MVRTFQPRTKQAHRGRTPFPDEPYFFGRFRSNARNAFFTASPFTWAYCWVVRRLLCPIRSRRISVLCSPIPN